MAPGNEPDDQAKPVKPLNGPAGLNISPQVPKVARVSWRVFGIVAGVLVLMVVGLYYGLKHRGEEVRAAKADTRPIAPALMRGRELAKSIEDAQKLQAAKGAAPPEVFCTVDPVTGQPDRFERRTGAPCTQWVPMLPMEAQSRPQLPPTFARAPQRHAPPQSSPFSPPSPVVVPSAVVPPADPDRERKAMLAPTTSRQNGGSSSFSQPNTSPAAESSLSAHHVAEEAMRRAESRLAEYQQSQAQSLGERDGQSDKERFLDAARKHAEQDYLPAVRTEALSPYEIRAGWIIPAVLEQRLNSDLPGEVRALVMTSVYDTATGAHLLIPQGSRLIGKYDSRISYGQSNVQVVWDRLIYPDGSALDLDGMAGMDSEGDAGLHDQVDRHYKRIFGFAALTSMMAAGLALAQQGNYGGYYGYPSPQQMATAAAGREMAEAGMEITRKNLNVQPTVKIRAGERFAVKVNRDIIFDGPYVPRPKRR
jgi:type IV secretion system protein VirB10